MRMPGGDTTNGSLTTNEHPTDPDQMQRVKS